MAKISRRTALLSALGVSLGVGVGVAATRAKPAPEPVAAPTPTPTPPPPARPRTPTPTPSPSPPGDTRPRWPLTGKLVKGKDKNATRHAAVAVKVPDNRQEHPQRGIDEADIVFVQLEGYQDAAGYSATRLVPVFHTRMPDSVAPVRSIRPVDIPLLSPMDAVIGNTGAAPWVINYVKHYRAHLEGMLSFLNTRGTGSYGTDQSRVYTYNGQTYYDRAITCHPAVLARQTKRFRSGPPRPYFPFAPTAGQSSAADGKRARSIEVPYKGEGYPMGYRYDKRTERYQRSMPWGPHVLADGSRVSTDNVLVIKAKQRFGKIFRGRGHVEPLHDIIDAKGTFHYFHGGRYVTGTWRKGKVQERFEFTLPDGKPFRMAPGQTFVELPDRGAKLRIEP